MPIEELGNICTVRKVALAVYSVTPSCAGPPAPVPLANYWSVIECWGSTWLWENLTIWGEILWLGESIADNSLVAVTDQSYMKETYPQLNLRAFIFECTKGRGRLWGSFVKNTPDAGSYWGELLGLMAIHLILQAIDKVTPSLRGSVHILLDCLSRALCEVENLPPYRIPTQCNHSDILKNIMANCSNLPFTQILSHIKAYQGDSKKYGDLTCEAQLNYQMDYMAKSAIYVGPNTQSNQTKCFPLEPL